MPRRLCLVVALLCEFACATTGSKTSWRPPGSVLFGIMAYSGVEASKTDAHAMETTLSHRMGQPVVVRVYAHESEIAAALASGDIDAAWMPPLAFADARTHGDVRPLIKLMRHGFGHYRSVFFSRTDHSLRSLEDLQGTTIAWVDRQSASGYLFALAILKKAGLTPSTLFAREIFAGDHAAVCKAVLEGTADVGATFADDQPNDRPRQVDGCIESLGPDKAGKLSIISFSKPIPNDVIAVRPGYSTDAASALKNMLLLLGIDQQGKDLLKYNFKADAFTEVSTDELKFSTDDAQ